MKFTRLGRTGLQVSRICLGCMTYGDPAQGAHAWTLDEAASRPLIRQALEAGINFFDTANIYSNGSSEEILGRALKDFAAPRDEVVVATKLRFGWGSGPNRAGLSRKVVFSAIDASLQRLGMDHVDLLQIHRWDNDTPIEETMQALHEVVKAGKARYIGASSMAAWQFAKAQRVAALNGLTPFVSMQPEYSLLYREEEREMLPQCADMGVGVIAWSPLARGRLARPWGQDTARIDTDKFGSLLFGAAQANDAQVAAALAAVAGARGVPLAQVALAWLLHKPVVSAPIVGASKPGQIEDVVAALELSLSSEEIKQLEAPYQPHAVVGF